MAGAALLSGPADAEARTAKARAQSKTSIGLLAGAGAPAKSAGKVGWFYIDERNHVLYGPRGKGGWGHGFSLLGVPGNAGAQGAAGVSGPTGAAGPAGPDGATGPAGSAGTQGATGAVGATGTAGPAGTAGPQGATGDTGAMGATGATGSAGTNGANGIVYPMLTGAGSPGANGVPEQDGQPYLDLSTGQLYLGSDGIWGSPVNVIPTDVATLGADGTVGGPSGSPLASDVLQTTRTIRGSLVVGSDTSESVSGFTDWTQRILGMLPSAPVRFRFRVANNCVVLGPQTAAVTIAGIYIGQPKPVTGARWNGTFAKAPTEVVAGGTTPTTGNQEYVTPWIQNDGLISAGQPFGLSMGFTATAGTVCCLSATGDPLCWSGTGASLQAGSSSAPTIGTAAIERLLDVRLEYEFETTPEQGKKFIAVLGDSISYGWNTSDGGAGSTWESWPGQAMLRTGHHFANLSVGGMTAAQPAETFLPGASWLWERIDLATTVPDVAIISLGTNDLDGGAATAAQTEAALATLIETFQSMGVGEIYLGTLIPRMYTGAVEANRLSLNHWIRLMPQNVAGVFDFDKIIGLNRTLTTAVSLSSGSTAATITGETGSGVYNGASVYGTGIASGTTVTAGGGVGQTALTLSAAATAAGSQQLTFVNPGSQSDPDLHSSAGAHPTRAGYQAMAASVTAGLS